MKFAIIFILLFSATTFTASAQTLAETLGFAEEQYKLQNYDVALQAFERVYFFTSEPGNTYLIKKIADCYFSIKDYNNAAVFYELAYSNTNNDSIRNELILNKASSYILQNEPNMALIELLNLNETDSDHFKFKENLFYGIVYFKNEEFDLAQQYFSEIDKYDENYLIALNDIFKRNAKAERINPKTAKILSVIIPGAGQFYLKDYKNAINSIVLNGGLLYLYFRVSLNTSFLDAFISIYPWYSRYFSGGYKNAERLAILKKQTLYNDNYNEILDLIEKEANENFH